MRSRLRLRLIGWRGWRDARGFSAVEFAIIAPVLILLLFGGFTIAQAIAINRKVTVTTRALADLTSQYAAMTSTDMLTVMKASKQILAPFDSSRFGIRITQVKTDATGKNATVDWSAGLNTTCFKKNDPFNLPTGMRGVANASFIYAETFYPYNQNFGGNVIGPINMGDNIYMLPRISQTVTYSGGATCEPSA